MTSNRTVKTSKNEVKQAIVNGMKAVVGRRSTPWVGTMTELKEVLSNRVEQNLLPGSSSALRMTLNTMTRRLKTAGLKVRFSRSTDRKRTRLVEISKVEKTVSVKLELV